VSQLPVAARRRRPAVVLAAGGVLAVLAVLAAACDLVPGVGVRTWGLTTTNQAGVDQAVQVTDTSGVVRDVQFDPVDADLFGGVTAPPGQPNTLDVAWTAGACDTGTGIAIERRGQGLHITVSITGGEGCDAFGTPRAIRLRLVEPVAPGAVSVTQ